MSVPRIDVVTIFPDYLAPLGLSIVGRARRGGLLETHVHDLRDWATDAHRTVDDTPAGGGPGMVMRPDVWGRALDDVLALAPEPAVLILPTPAGEVFTQATAWDLARSLAGGERLVIACGRYEGIDSRVAEHYAEAGLRVREVSIGDYVLGGGEVAALVVVEAVARLLPGVVGNAESLVEESHGAAGLLEGPVFTRPPTWRGLAVPEVLMSGHHALVTRWRRDAALARTAARRPDLLTALDPAGLDGADRRTLAALGRVVLDGAVRRVEVRRAGPADAVLLAELAAATFPLACPPGTDPGQIAAHVAAHLSVEAFARLLADPGRNLVLVAADGDRLLGYTLAVLPGGAAERPEPAVEGVEGPLAELGKCYVRRDLHGTGLAQLLLAATHDALAGCRVEGRPVAAVWLGTNRRNRRAQRFYARAGYAVVGGRRFLVGDEPQDDVVMLRRLPEPTGGP